MNDISRLTEKAYYLLRAESELRMARRARHEAAARAHFMIAGLCLDKAHRTIGSDPGLASP
ncbi:hypothetical protein [Sphingosinicella terrae]|uniref:hypothetical protein n=1 Tax=Sphingosinicella terrae TaxID=2172047 RepID=UPI000E0D697F|nr:hypothetical protein [Sphingosinicella terrae]